MDDKDKTKEQLVKELKKWRQRVNDLEELETRYRKNEKTLKESEKLFRSLMDNMLDPALILDWDGTILFANNAAVDFIGLKSPEDVVGNNATDFVHDNFRNSVRDHITLVKEDKGGFFAEYRIKTVLGEERWVEGLGTKISFRGRSANLVNLRDITRRKDAEKALQDSDETLKNIIHGSPIPAFVIDQDHKVIYWNMALEKYSGIKSEELIGTDQQWKAFYSEKRPCIADLLVDGNTEEIPRWYQGKWAKSNLVEGAYEAVDFFPHLGDEGKWLYFTAAAIKDTEGNVIGAIETLEDITQRKNAEQQLKASLNEKEILLREIHHRVKNNLQIISSLLSLQSRYIKDEKSKDLFIDSQNRVKSMALLHENLYKSEGFARVDFHDYIMTLTRYLFRLYGATIRKINPRIEIGDIFLDIDTAIPCGLIINELVSNSLKYAFPDDRTGEIAILLHADNDIYTLMVSDNGIGLPQDMDFENTKTLGLRLVKTLAEQIDGKIELRRDLGTTISINFKEPE